MILNIFTSGFSPEADLLLVGVRTHTGECKLWRDSEGFLDYFLKTDDKIVIGFNILKFDIPFLLLKSQKSQKFPEFFKKINYSNVVDLFPILTFRNRGVIKGLEFYLEKEGIRKDFLSDLEIARKSKEDSIAQEVGKKLEAINSLYWRLKGKG